MKYTVLRTYAGSRVRLTSTVEASSFKDAADKVQKELDEREAAFGFEREELEQEEVHEVGEN